MFQAWQIWFILGPCIQDSNIRLGCIGLLVNPFKSLKTAKYITAIIFILILIVNFSFRSWLVYSNVHISCRDWSLISIILISRQWSLQVTDFAFFMPSLFQMTWFLLFVKDFCMMWAMGLLATCSNESFFLKLALALTGMFYSYSWINLSLSLPVWVECFSLCIFFPFSFSFLYFCLFCLPFKNKTQVNQRFVQILLTNLSHLGFEEIILLLSYRSHETMSVKIIDHIVNEHHIDIDPEMIKKVKVSVCLINSLSTLC